MTRIPNWKKVKHINKEARKVTRLAKKKRIIDVAVNIIKKYKVPFYKKHVIKDDHGNITTKLDPITRKYKGHTRIRKRKIMDYKDFKNHYSIIPNHIIKRLNLAVSIIKLIAKIDGTTDLNKIANKYYRKLKLLKKKKDQDDSDQLDSQIHNQDNSDHLNSNDPNPDNFSNDNPGKMPGD